LHFIFTQEFIIAQPDNSVKEINYLASFTLPSLVFHMKVVIILE